MHNSTNGVNQTKSTSGRPEKESGRGELRLLHHPAHHRLRHLHHAERSDPRDGLGGLGTDSVDGVRHLLHFRRHVVRRARLHDSEDGRRVRVLQGMNT
jgi:hypothetical protein